MLKTIMIRSTLLAFACSISVAAHAIADSPKQINVPAGDLVTALESLARQADISVVYQAEQLAGLRTHGVQGNFTPQEAVIKLLKGTKLNLRTDATTGAMLIEPPHANGLSGNSNDPSAAGSDEDQEGKKGSSGEFRVA
jgi:iron complex outermembrane recepter protein